MKKHLLLLLMLTQLQCCFGQDYLDYEKELLLVKLKDLGFDSITGSKKRLLISSQAVIAQFNDNYCTRIEYHLKNDGEMDFCDSIFCTSTCNECFNVTLNMFINIKNKRWKKNSDNQYFSLKHKGKSIAYGPPKEIKYNIEQLEIIRSTENSPPSFYIHRVWVTQSEYDRLKRLN